MTRFRFLSGMAAAVIITCADVSPSIPMTLPELPHSSPMST
jgi:hypothetical protein